MADRPLRPATDRSLGRPLPHQLANRTRAHRKAVLRPLPLRAHAVLAAVSSGCSPLHDRFPRVTHPCATNARRRPFDLHVLSMPPAFVLSQDQTLKLTMPNQHSCKCQPDPRSQRCRSHDIPTVKPTKNLTEKDACPTTTPASGTSAPKYQSRRPHIPSNKHTNDEKERHAIEKTTAWCAEPARPPQACRRPLRET